MATPQPNRARRHGLSIVEMLIALALVAALLTAVGAALHASIQSYSENDELAAVTQSARSIMNRMAKEIRSSEDVSSTSTSLTILPAADGSGVQEIKYELAGGKLNYHVKTAGTWATHVLLGDTDDRVRVTAFSVNRVMGTDATGQACTKTASVKLTFAIDNQSFTLTASGSPRRNQLF